MIAKQTAGLTGADLANICNEAAIFAGRNRRDVVLMQDFDAALERTVAGMQSDYDRAELLLAFVNALRSDARVRQAFVDAAQGIHSSYDQNRVLAALARSESR